MEAITVVQIKNDRSAQPGTHEVNSHRPLISYMFTELSEPPWTQFADQFLPHVN